MLTQQKKDSDTDSVASSLTLVDPPTTPPIPIPPARRQSPCLDYPSNLAWPRRDITTSFLRSPPSPRLPGIRLVPQQRIVGFHVSTAVEGSAPPSSSAPISTQDETSASVELPLPVTVAPSQISETTSPGYPRPPSSPQPIFLMDEDLGFDSDCDESNAAALPSYGATKRPTGEEGDLLQSRERESVASRSVHVVRENGY